MKMKAVAIIIISATLIAAAIWFADDSIAPLFLNSRIERLVEKNLPRIFIENERAIYCRMKADDFRFPLPSGSRAVNPVVTGGFDTVDGSVEARFEGTNQLANLRAASEYQSWLASGKLQVGGHITAEPISGGLLIKFHYFGDK